MTIADYTFCPWRLKDGSCIVANEATWKKPVKWNRLVNPAHWTRRPRVLVDCDVFEEWTGHLLQPTFADVQRRLFETIDDTPHLDWIVTTRHPQNIAGMMPPTCDTCSGFRRFEDTKRCRCGGRESTAQRRNLWLIAHASDQATADESIPHLLKVPAAVRGVRLTLTGPVELQTPGPYRQSMPEKISRGMLLPIYGMGGLGVISPGIDWVIVSGETGPNARPCRVEWIRDIVRQCKAAGVACFVERIGKSPLTNITDGWGESVVFHKSPDGPLAFAQLRDRKGGDWDEWPEDLRVREFPEAKGGAS